MTTSWTESTSDNSTYNKLAVQWLNEALPAVLLRGVLRSKFSGGRQFSSPKSPPSGSCKTLYVIFDQRYKKRKRGS